MKILQLIDTLQSGGAERFVVDLSNEFVRQGHEVILVTLAQTADNPVTSYYFKFVDSRVRIVQLNLKH